MSNLLSEAEAELIELYNQKAFDAYQAGQLAEAARCAQRILRYDPEDSNALFLKGATIGRSSKPGQLYFRQAFAIWKPLVDTLDGEDRAVMLDAIAAAFAIMTETPVMMGFRFWESYHSAATAAALRDVLQELLTLEDELIRTPADESWIRPLFRANCQTWVYDVVGADLAVPTAAPEDVLDAFYGAAHAAYELAKRMPEAQKGTALLRRRTLTALEHFEARNGSAAHPERTAYLQQELARLNAPRA